MASEGDEWSDQEGWSDQEEILPEQEPAWSGEEQSWDDDTDDEWVFDGTSSDRPDQGPADDGGIVWDDSDSDDIHFGDPQAAAYDDDDVVGPEFELAGRRDVRPRAPRPRQAATSRPKSRRADAPPPRRRSAAGKAATATAEPGGEPVDHQPGPMVIESAEEERVTGRFARTQATIEQSQDAPQPTRRMPTPSSSRQAAPRRRQAQPAATATSYARPARRGRMPLIILLIAALISGGGWVVYRELSGQSLLGGWRDSIGLGGENRTAADTPFNQTLTPEEAIGNLPVEPRDDGPSIDVHTLDIFDKDGKSQAGGPLNPDYDPAIRDGDEPPIPKFKPRFNQQELKALSRSIATRSDEPAPAEQEAEPDPSILERLWQYLGLG